MGNEPADYSSDLRTPFSSPRVLGLKMMLREVHAQVAEADGNSGKSSGSSSIVDSSVLVVEEELQRQYTLLKEEISRRNRRGKSDGA